MTRKPMSPELEKLLDAEREVEALTPSAHDALKDAVRRRIGPPDGTGGDDGGGGEPDPDPTSTPPGGGTGSFGKMASVLLLGAVIGYGVRWWQEPVSEPEEMAALEEPTLESAASALIAPAAPEAAPQEAPAVVDPPDGAEEVDVRDVMGHQEIGNQQEATERTSAPSAMSARSAMAPTDMSANDEVAVPTEMDGPTARRMERVLVDRARAALGQRAYGEVLRTLLRHEAEYPQGALAEDREALRIRALLGLGQTERAARAFSRFESRYPQSPYRRALAQEFRP